ncbi:hypothetical protein A2V49_01595 [candidate division WWE3 bacterium RBG_19FT_COMBO_34_6]|uniref:Uncharacterized protein n=1 Tax=candidate division WWE3 bacterium RBG_19FT_COMBO_34_6 TaxID=1802612 RepID=A0A1F4UJZ1_UNCKA|nr:MAG: hypothetical protein A2V49_01595 [candidate division WWE3 bacterium RBG_19FT_COMBO_34_6]
MDTYTIKWGPEKKEGKILLHLIDPLQIEIDSEWVPEDYTEEKAELLFKHLGRTLPEDEKPNHQH